MMHIHTHTHIYISTKIIQLEGGEFVVTNDQHLYMYVYHEPRYWFIIGIDRKFDKNAQKNTFKNYLNDFNFS